MNLTKVVLIEMRSSYMIMIETQFHRKELILGGLKRGHPSLNIERSLKQKFMFAEPSFDVGGNSKVLVPKSQLIFGDQGNETSFFVQTEVIFKGKPSHLILLFIWYDQNKKKCITV